MPDRPLSEAEATAERYVTTLRVPAAVGRWIVDEAAAQGISTNEFLTRWIDDGRTIFGLPDLQVDALEEDRKALGLTWRRYFLHVLAHRYAEVLQRGPGFEKAPARGAAGLARSETKDAGAKRKP